MRLDLRLYDGSMEEGNMSEEEFRMQNFPGSMGPVGEKQISQAMQDYKDYKSRLEPLIHRMINAEEWWKMNHWERFANSAGEDEIKPVSGWLFNSVINKHADFMDNYPAPAILPREKSDEQTAKMLSEVVPVILEQNGYDETYSECSWDKIKMGTAVYGVTWNPLKENGIGDVEVSQVDLLSIVWEPGVKKIQDSRNVFVTQIVDEKTLKEQYPFVQDKVKGGYIDKPKYLYEENLDTTDKVMVIDWYYKKHIQGENGAARTILHYCKFVEGCVLYASENDVSRVDKGWYEHGQYPFVFDVMFPEKGSPAGFGYLDIMVNPQEYIDKLDKVILENCMMNRPRYFVSNGTAVNTEEFADLTKQLVTVNGDVDDHKIKQIIPPEMSQNVLTQRDAKVNELKETSGNRDFSQGSTTSGVTAASAIAALQEAGSKLSRDMIKTTYTAHSQVVKLTIELIREFYTLPRCFRITNANGQTEYVQMDNTGMMPQQTPMLTQEDMAVRRPIYDVKVSAMKASPYSRIAQNELAKELYGMGVFNPQLADQAKAVVQMMDFDRKDEVLQTIEKNGTMFQQLQQMQQTMQQMAAVIAGTTGDTRILDAMQAQGMGAEPAMTGVDVQQGTARTDSMGNVIANDASTAGKARARVAGATEVR